MPHAEPKWDALVDRAEALVRAVLDELPEPLRPLAAGVPVILEPRPAAEFVEAYAEITEDLMGLFSGPSYRESEFSDDPMPPEIRLYLRNIWDEAEGDPERFDHETRITLLHEFGHYLGLDEDDLFDRELD